MPPKKKKVRKLLTNAAVLESLRLQNPKRKKKLVSHFEWIHNHATDFLSSGPSARSDLHSSLPDTLTEEEKLQIVNIVPTEIVDLFLIIDNLNERFTEAQQEELLTLIQPNQTSLEDDTDQQATAVNQREETPPTPDAIISCDDTTEMITEPTNEEDFTDLDVDESIAPTAEAVISTPPNPNAIELKSIEHKKMPMHPIDAKHVMNGGLIPPNAEHARNGLVSLPKVKLESS